MLQTVSTGIQMIKLFVNMMNKFVAKLRYKNDPLFKDIKFVLYDEHVSI
jgi:hypothetical protein